MEELFKYMEDFDDWSLSTEERKEQLLDAVGRYNEENNTAFKPNVAYLQYENSRKESDI